VIGAVVVDAGDVVVVVMTSGNGNGGRVSGVRFAGTGFMGRPMGRRGAVVVTAAGSGALWSLGRSSSRPASTIVATGWGPPGSSRRLEESSSPPHPTATTTTSKTAADIAKFRFLLTDRIADVLGHPENWMRNQGLEQRSSRALPVDAIAAYQDLVR
jgi:hypothetical protein